MATVKFVDTTLRDGHQCLWATRMSTAMMRPIMERMDRIGFEAIEVMGAVHFDACVRYLKDDPWERIRLLRRHVRGPLQVITRSRCALGFELQPIDIHRLFMVTPFSQLVGVQATLNVLEGERYARIPDEVKRFALGYYGTLPAPPSRLAGRPARSQGSAVSSRRSAPVNMSGRYRFAGERSGSSAIGEERCPPAGGRRRRVLGLDIPGNLRAHRTRSGEPAGDGVRSMAGQRRRPNRFAAIRSVVVRKRSSLFGLPGVKFASRT